MLYIKYRNKGSSANQIKIKEVKDGILCLPNNLYSGILETSSVNFELKSISEQEILLYSFETFLNSLPCPIQILVRTREVVLEEYLERIDSLGLKENEIIYKKQLKSYSEFISKLIVGNKILSRKFYVIYSYNCTSEFSVVKEHMQLLQNILVSGFERLSMKANPQSSLDILKIFYTFYQPERSKVQTLTNGLFDNI